MPTRWQAGIVATAVFLQLSAAAGSVINGVTDADYSSCSAGKICTPMCKYGFSPTGASKGFTLAFDANGNFDAAADKGNLECSANICSGTVVNGVTDADYSPCTKFTTTGGKCVPRECEAGYRRTGASSGFTLVCDKNGDYSASADTGDMMCTIDIHRDL
jgi:hypothetical protein